MVEVVTDAQRILREAYADCGCGIPSPFDEVAEHAVVLAEAEGFKRGIAYTPRADVKVSERKRVARIVNPHAFTSWQSLYEYCLRQGDSETEALQCANNTHKADCDKALAKADAILATLRAGGEVREAADLAWFSGERRLSLQFYSPMYGDDDDQSEEWRVDRESGPINDREWETVGRGATAAQAIAAARAALAPAVGGEGV